MAWFSYQVGQGGERLLQTTESKFEESTFVVGGSYVLNDIGKHLLRILGG